MLRRYTISRYPLLCHHGWNENKALIKFDCDSCQSGIDGAVCFLEVAIVIFFMFQTAM